MDKQLFIKLLESLPASTKTHTIADSVAIKSPAVEKLLDELELDYAGSGGLLSVGFDDGFILKCEPANIDELATIRYDMPTEAEGRVIAFKVTCNPRQAAATHRYLNSWYSQVFFGEQHTKFATVKVEDTPVARFIGLYVSNFGLAKSEDNTLTFGVELGYESAEYTDTE